MLRIIFLLSICFGLLISPANAQKKQTLKELNKHIKQATEKYELPGLAVGIIKDGEVVMLEGYGYANTETKEKVDENTLFGIASCSKAFTAACIAILVDRGEINWDDKVIDHYPGFQLYDPYITRDLMIKDLLCHRAGYQTFDGDLLWYGSDYSRAEIIQRFANRENPYSLREKWGYSNIMYIAAGEVIYHVTGMTWEEFVTENILLPIGMETTTTTTDGFKKGMNIAWPHLDSKPMEFINYDNSGPAAALNTSAKELLNWVQLMLNKGALNDTSVFSESQYYQLTMPQTLLNAGRANTPDGTHFSAYGLGWSMKDYGGMKVLSHGGGLPGFHSKVTFLPEAGVGYVILANEISLLVPALDRDILEFYVNDSVGYVEKYFPYKAMQEERDAKKWTELEEQRNKNTKPSLDLESYVGMYEDKMYGLAEISMKDEKLYFEMLPSKALLSSPMEHWHYDTFKVRVDDPFLPEGFVTFQVAEDGSVESFKVNIDNPDFHFYKLEFKKTN